MLIAKEMNTSKISARNNLYGKIVKISESAVIAEVILELSGRNTVGAMIRCDSIHDEYINESDCVFAVFKRSGVMVGMV